MSGKSSFKELQTYGTGYGLRRFVMHNKVIKNPHVLYEQIDVHVLLCMITM